MILAFQKSFYERADIPTVFFWIIHRTLGYKTPIWLDDIIIVTTGNTEDNEIQKHTKKIKVLKN